MTQSTNRVTFVTGAGQGLGAEIARHQASGGDTVVVTDIVLQRAQAVADEITAAGGEARAYKVDVRDKEEIESTMKAVVAEFGSLDRLVCNAGLLRDNLIFKMTDEDWDMVIATHLTGAFYCARAAQRHMVENNFGRIVFVSSRAGQGNRGQTNYSAAKAGLQGMAKTLAIELGRFNIVVNAIAPGHIETAMTHATAERMGIPYAELAKATIEKSAIKRVGQPKDVAHTVSFFLSDANEYVTGQVLHITGRPLG